MENNLLELLNKKDEEISYYLEDVSIDQFKMDILHLSKVNINEILISELIENLQKLIYP